MVFLSLEMTTESPLLGVILKLSFFLGFFVKRRFARDVHAFNTELSRKWLTTAGNTRNCYQVVFTLTQISLFLCVTRILDQDFHPLSISIYNSR